MKVAIVGAGICGLYLAQKLAEKGNKVTIFEKRQKIGKDVCSGLFSERIFNFLPESKKLPANEIKRALIHFPKKTINVNFKKRFVAMNHAALDNLAADKAKTLGVEIRLGRNINDLPKNFDRIVGCDGALSAVRRKLGIKDPSFRMGMIAFAEKKCAYEYVCGLEFLRVQKNHLLCALDLIFRGKYSRNEKSSGGLSSPDVFPKPPAGNSPKSGPGAFFLPKIPFKYSS